MSRRPLIRVIAAPDGAAARHPLSLGEVKAHLRVLSSAEDAHIGWLMHAALEYLEGVDGRGGITGRSLVRRTREAAWEAFPATDRLEIPLPPLEAVEAIQYVDTSGALQTLDPSAYEVAPESLFGLVALKTGRAWPPTAIGLRAVRVRFLAGYPDAAFPKDLRAALLLHIGHLYANRESVAEKSGTVVPQAYEALIAPYMLHGWI